MKLKNISFYFSLIVSSVILITIALFFNANTSCNFEFKGNISVESKMLKDIISSLSTINVPLNDLKIKVEYKKCKYCIWRKAGETTTDTNGDFILNTLLTGKACTDGIRTKVSLKFESDQLELREAGLNDETGKSPKWHKAGYLTNGQCKNTNTCNFGNLKISDSGEYELGNQNTIVHADLWHLYNYTSNYFSNINIPISPNNEKIVAIYPLNRIIISNSREGSYVTPSSKYIHLHKNHNNFDLAIHELAHVWAFNNTDGESIMSWYLATKLTTHDKVENTAVAFHEGLAEFIMKIIKNNLRSDYGKNKITPEIYLKKWLNEEMNLQSNTSPVCEHSQNEMNRKNDLSRLDCYENGWLNIFNILTIDDHLYPEREQKGEILLYNIYENQNPNGILATTINNGTYDLDIQNFNCFKTPLNISIEKLFETIKNMDSSQMNLNGFFDRLVTVNQLNQDEKNLFVSLLDPSNKENMTPYYCQNSFIIDRFELSHIDLDHLKYDWREENNYFVKEVPFEIIAKNYGYSNTPINTFVKTPINYLHTSTTNPFEKELVKVPVASATPTILPGTEARISQVIKIPKDENGNFPATNLKWKTIINQPKILSSIGHLWKTNERNFTFGIDLKTTTRFNPSPIINQSGSPNQIDIKVSKTRKTKIEFTSPNNSRTKNYRLIKGKCEIANIGNVESIDGTSVKIKINNQFKIISINKIYPENKTEIPINIFLEKGKIFDPLELSCKVDSENILSEIFEDNNHSISNIN